MIYRSFGEVSHACNHGYAARRSKSWEVNEVATVIVLLLLKLEMTSGVGGFCVSCERVLDATKNKLFIRLYVNPMDLRCCTTIIIRACVLITFVLISLTDYAQPVLTQSLQTSVLQCMYRLGIRGQGFVALK